MTAIKDQTFLVTGAMGCIGSWVVYNLVREGTRVVSADITDDPVRPRLLLSEEELSGVTFLRTDITDSNDVTSLIEQNRITHIIHLAALQVPFCRADPSLGSRVNVVGTVNIFEAARLLREQIQGLTYASSAAVFGPRSLYRDSPVTDEAPLYPGNLYGAYKQANETTARIYWQDGEVGSVGLRPYIVYGVGRDQGMTSDIAKAILAASADRSFHIKFGGEMCLQYAHDVARMFIQSARAHYKGAATCNVRNDVLTVEEFVEKLKEELPGAEVSCEGTPSLGLPSDMDDSGLRAIIGDIPHTPLDVGIVETIRRFKRLTAAGRIDLNQLGA